MSTGLAWNFGPANNMFVYGDGTSTTLTVDLTGFIEATPVVPKCPTSVLSCTVNANTVSSTSLSGNNLTINFTTAPAASYFGVQLVLGF